MSKAKIKMIKDKERRIKLKLGYFDYTLIFRRDSDDDYGKTDLEGKVIYVNTRYNLQAQKETLFHELLHVSLEDCPLWEATPEKHNDMEEAVVRFISPRMMDYLAHNPFLRLFIFGSK